MDFLFSLDRNPQKPEKLAAAHETTLFDWIFRRGIRTIIHVIHIIHNLSGG